jgi:hypothetical protein
MTERELRVLRAQSFYDGFYYCPTTRRILEGLPGDDKVLCGCRTSNPKVPAEATERTGTHIRRFLEPATPEAYVDQQDRDGISG